jgi:hypothetical protein
MKQISTVALRGSRGASLIGSSAATLIAMSKTIAYGRLPAVTVYAVQDGRKFSLVLGRDDSRGFVLSRRPIMTARYPGRGGARAARQWFKQHAARHGFRLTFD